LNFEFHFPISISAFEFRASIPNMTFWRKRVIQSSLDRDVEAAAKEQEAILEREPDNARAHFALGTLSHFRGQTDEAIRFFRRAIELDAAYAAPHVGLGRIYIVRKLYAEAWEHAREAQRLGDRTLVEQLERYPGVK